MRADPSILPLRLTGVWYRVGETALVSDLSFTLAAGGRTVILGPNGAGKSVLLRLCHGLIAPSAGRIEWAGAGAGGTIRAHAMVFQRPVLLRRSARANIAHALSLGGVPAAERRVRAAAARERFGLAGLAGRPARALSGGEQQRVALARAWAVRPQVLFLDEPTAALDPAATRAVEEMITAFHGDGVKIVMSTHDLGQARRLGDEILFLHRGRLIEQAPAETFFRRPQTPEAAGFIRGELPW